jgi:hypothetical protein
MAQTDLPSPADNPSEEPEFSSLTFLDFPHSAQMRKNGTTKTSELHPLPHPLEKMNQKKWPPLRTGTRSGPSL